MNIVNYQTTTISSWIMAVSFLGGCAVETTDSEDVRSLEQDVWAENDSPFAVGNNNVDARVTGLPGSVVQIRSSMNGTPICTGTLIAQDTRDKVLTAAHCVTCGGTFFVAAGPNATTSNSEFIAQGVAICSPAAGTENDKWPGTPNVCGANDVAVIDLQGNSVPVDMASVATVYLGSRPRNGLALHEGGGNATVNEVVTLIGYGEPCKFGETCVGDGVRRTINAWGYNWWDKCASVELPVCSDTPVIAVSAPKSKSGAAPGDSGGPMFFQGKQVGVSSLQVTTNPLGFTGNVYAPVSTNITNARFLKPFVQPPEHVSIEDVGILATGEANVNDRAQVGGTVAAGEVEIGSDARVNGNVYSEDTIFIRDRGGYTGEAKGYGGISYQNLPGQIGPLEATMGSLPLEAVQECRDFFAGIAFSGPSTWVNYELQGNQTQREVELPPGQYGRVRVKRGVNLRLLPGAYYFRELDIDIDSTITPAGSATNPTWVYVQGTLNMKGRTVSSAQGASSELLFGVLGTSTVHVQKPNTTILYDYQATIYAPYAKVEVHNRVVYRGQIIAKDVEIHQDASFTYAEFSGGTCEAP